MILTGGVFMLNFLTTTTVCGFSLYHVLAFFLIYSCTGWCLEVIFAAATTGQLVNRGFLNGPVCPIYGFGMIIVLFTLTPLQDNVLLLYIGGVILPSALELVGGWALYKLYHTRWWDYSDFPFNIGGYICLQFSLLWGVGTLVVMRIVHPVVAGLVDMVPPFIGLVVMCVLYAVYAADVVVTAFAASGLAQTLDAMEQLADSIHAVSDAMTQLLGTTALNADQKLDEQRLQLKLAAAEAREAAPEKRALRETLAAVRAKTDEAREAAKHASEIAKLNTAEAAKAAQLAAKGTMERAAELLRLGGSLVIYGGGRLQLFFLALLLHSGVVGKVEDEVTEERGLGHDDFYQDIHVGKYTEVHGVIADTSTGDGIDLYVGFQEAQGRELLNDDFLPGTADTGFFLYTRLGVMERLVFKRNLFYCKPVEQNQLVGSQTVVK